MVNPISESQWLGEYENKVNEGEAVVLIFTASWCSSCHSLVEKLNAADFNVETVQLDVDEAVSISDRFNVTGLPCVLIFMNGDLLDRFDNNVDHDEIMDAIMELED